MVPRKADAPCDVGSVGAICDGSRVGAVVLRVEQLQVYEVTQAARPGQPSYELGAKSVPVARGRRARRRCHRRFSPGGVDGAPRRQASRQLRSTLLPRG